MDRTSAAPRPLSVATSRPPRSPAQSAAPSTPKPGCAPSPSSPPCPSKPQSSPQTRPVSDPGSAVVPGCFRSPLSSYLYRIKRIQLSSCVGKPNQRIVSDMAHTSSSEIVATPQSPRGGPLPASNPPGSQPSTLKPSPCLPPCPGRNPARLQRFPRLLCPRARPLPALLHDPNRPE